MGVSAAFASVAVGAYGVVSSNKNASAARNSQTYDPFAAWRPGYAVALSDLMKDPSSITSDPGYTFGMNEAEMGASKSLASMGLSGSGTAAEALYSTGQKYASSYLSQKENFLAGLAGSGINNAGIAAQMTNAGQQSQQNALALLLKGMYGVGQSDWWNGGGGGSSDAMWSSVNSFDQSAYGGPY